MVALLLDALAGLVPAGTAVSIATLIYKLARHAIDDSDRWRRLMFVVVK